MKRQWNPIYKRFECKFCGEEWCFKESHECKKAPLSIVDMHWEGIKDKESYRKEFNKISNIEYAKYDSVADYAFYNRIAL